MFWVSTVQPAPVLCTRTDPGPSRTGKVRMHKTLPSTHVREKSFQHWGLSETSPYLGTLVRNWLVQTPFKSSDSRLQKHVVSQQVPQVRWHKCWKILYKPKFPPTHDVTLETHCVNFNCVFQTVDILSGVLAALANLVFSHILQAARLIFVYASLSCNANQATAFGKADSNILLR